MRKIIIYGITIAFLLQTAGCGQTAPATEVPTEIQVSEDDDTATDESAEETSIEEPEHFVNEYGDIEEHEQHKYGTITRYIVKRDGYDQTEEFLVFTSPVVVLDNSCLTVSITGVNCTRTADGWTLLGYSYDAYNKLSDRSMCILGKDETVTGEHIDFPYGGGDWTVGPKQTKHFDEGSEELNRSDITIEDMIYLEGNIQCDREQNGSYGSDSDDYSFSLKDSLR